MRASCCDCACPCTPFSRRTRTHIVRAQGGQHRVEEDASTPRHSNGRAWLALGMGREVEAPRLFFFPHHTTSRESCLPLWRPLFCPALRLGLLCQRMLAEALIFPLCQSTYTAPPQTAASPTEHREVKTMTTRTPRGVSLKSALTSCNTAIPNSIKGIDTIEIHIKKGGQGEDPPLSDVRPRAAHVGGGGRGGGRRRLLPTVGAPYLGRGRRNGRGGRGRGRGRAGRHD